MVHLDRQCLSYTAAIAGIESGNTILIGGFGATGVPLGLIDALCRADLRDLEIVTNNAGTTDHDIARLFKEARVRRLICSFPRAPGNDAFVEQYRAGQIELELVPQGTLAERIRAGGAGIGGFFTPVAAGTILAEGKETRMIEDRQHIFEKPIRGHAALISANRADRLGNLTYRHLARNFAPAMAMAAAITVAEVSEMVPLGSLEPAEVVTPGIFVNRIVEKGAPL